METKKENVDAYNELYYVGCYLSEAIDALQSIVGFTPKFDKVFDLNERWKSIAIRIAEKDLHKSYR